MKTEPPTIILTLTLAEAKALGWVLNNDATLWAALCSRTGVQDGVRLPAELITKIEAALANAATGSGLL